MEVLYVLKSEMINIVAQCNQSLEKSILEDFMIEVINKLPSELGDPESKIIKLSNKSFILDVKENIHLAKNGTLITITKDLDNLITIGNHSNRFHTLDISENSGVTNVTNIQAVISDNINFVTFSTIDKEVAQRVIKSLINIYNAFVVKHKGDEKYVC